MKQCYRKSCRYYGTEYSKNCEYFKDITDCPTAYIAECAPEKQRTSVVLSCQCSRELQQEINKYEQHDYTIQGSVAVTYHEGEQALYYSVIMTGYEEVENDK